MLLEASQKIIDNSSSNLPTWVYALAAVVVLGLIGWLIKRHR